MTDFTAVYLPALPEGEESRDKSGFETEEQAWDYIWDRYVCDACKSGPRENAACTAEWLVIPTEEYNTSENLGDLFTAAGFRKVPKEEMQLMTKVNELQQELERYKQWVNDLQSGMYINCVYCGHRYGPKENTPVSMADLLKEHIESCPEHPMSALKERIRILESNQNVK